MLAARVMPTTPLLKSRRRASSPFYDDDMYVPKVKRPCLYQGNHNENGIWVRSVDNKQNGLLPDCTLSSYSKQDRSKLLGRNANIEAKLQLSHLLKGDSLSFVDVYNGFKLESNVCHPHTNEHVVSSHKVPVINLKKNGVKVKKACAISTTQYSSSSDVDSDCSESSRMSIPKSKIKQPAIVLMKMNKLIKKKSVSPKSCPVSPQVTNVVVGGYVQRMASLNARACVAAYLEPEKKFAPKCPYRGGRKKTGGVKATSLDSARVKPTGCIPALKSASNLSAFEVEKVKPSPVVLSNEKVECIVPVHTSKTDFEVEEKEIEGEVSYNVEGLLYNGSTMHPDARVFRTDVPEFNFPARVIPTLVPARISTVKRVKYKAGVTETKQVDKKLNRVSSIASVA